MSFTGALNDTIISAFHLRALEIGVGGLAQDLVGVGCGRSEIKAFSVSLFGIGDLNQIDLRLEGAGFGDRRDGGQGERGDGGAERSHGCQLRSIHQSSSPTLWRPGDASGHSGGKPMDLTWSFLRLEAECASDVHRAPGFTWMNVRLVRPRRDRS